MVRTTDVQRGEQRNVDIAAAEREAGFPASPTDLGSDHQPSGKRNGRDRRGRFGSGNTAALKHGRFSMAVAKALLPEQREVLEMFAEREAALVVDLGGAEDLSTIERDLVRKYQQLHAVAEYSASRMFSPRAAVRREARDTFMTAISTQLKIVAQLGGPRRRQKSISDLSIGEYLALEKGGTSEPDGSTTTESGQSRTGSQSEAEIRVKSAPEDRS